MGKLKKLLLLFVTVLSISSCEDSANNVAQEKTYIVASKKINCDGVAPQKCYLIKKNGEKDWQNFYNEIIGFNYNEGFEYELLISETPIENPPQDASSIAYKLLKVISIIEKTSENLPE